MERDFGRCFKREVEQRKRQEARGKRPVVSFPKNAWPAVPVRPRVIGFRESSGCRATGVFGHERGISAAVIIGRRFISNRFYSPSRSLARPANAWAAGRGPGVVQANPGARGFSRDPWRSFPGLCGTRLSERIFFSVDLLREVHDALVEMSRL